MTFRRSDKRNVCYKCGYDNGAPEQPARAKGRKGRKR